MRITFLLLWIIVLSLLTCDGQLPLLANAVDHCEERFLPQYKFLGNCYYFLPWVLEVFLRSQGKRELKNYFFTQFILLVQKHCRILQIKTIRRKTMKNDF